MSVGLSITLSKDIQASNFVCSPIVGTINDDVISGESRWSGPSCSNRRTVPQLKRCPRGGEYFCRWAAKLSKLVLTANQNKSKTPGST